VAGHDDIVVGTTAKSSVKNRLPDCGVTMSRTVARGAVTSAPSRLIRFERGLSRR